MGCAGSSGVATRANGCTCYRVVPLRNYSFAAPGLGSLALAYPRLTPWATVFRAYGAGTNALRFPTLSLREKGGAPAETRNWFLRGAFALALDRGRSLRLRLAAAFQGDFG